MIKHPRLYIISVSILMFGLQTLFVRAFHLFFTQLDAQALVPWSFLGILLGCLLLAANHLSFVRKLTNLLNLRFVCVVLLLYALSTLYIIHFVPALFMVVLVNTGLGMCLARASMQLEAYRFYFLDFIGGIGGCLLAFFLPNVFSLESTYFIFVLLAALAISFGDHIRRKYPWKVACAILLAFSIFLAANPLADLSQYGALYQKPEDYALVPTRHGQLQLQLGRHERLFSAWSSAGKIEAHRSPLAEGEQIDFYVNNINYFVLAPYEARVVGDFGQGKSAVVVGSGGGMEMRFLRDQGFADLTSVEINEVIYKLMNGIFSDSAQNVFTTHQAILGEGRNFLELSPKTYDVIVLNYVGAAGGLIGSSDDLSENFLFTSEAFQTYYKRLNTGGFLVIGLVYSKDPFPNPNLIRTIESEASILRSFGEDPQKQIWFFGHERKTPSKPERRYRGLVVMRKGPATSASISKDEKFINDLRHGIGFVDAATIFKPKLSNDEILEPPSEVLTLQETYARQATSHSVASEIKTKYALNVTPTPDERPYFFFFAASPPFPLPPAGFLFWITTLIIFGMIYCLAQFPMQRRLGDRQLLSLAAALGFAYGILEISLLNAFTVAFSSITWNFLLMVFGLLSGSVMAGALGNKFSSLVRRFFILVSACSLIALFFFDFNAFIIQFANQYERSMILITITLIISFGASLSYPLLLKNSEGSDQRMPAFILGINSGFFIIGSIVCRYLALVLSLKHTFFLAGCIYLGVLVMLTIKDWRKAY